MMRQIRITLLLTLTGLAVYPRVGRAQTPDPNVTSIIEDTAVGTSLGTLVDAQNGPFVTISGGTPRGSALFHSFGDFRLGTGHTASFVDTVSSSTGVPIENVVSRVTGTERSIIFGKIHSDIPGANFFFLNPNGFFFGPGASLAVEGSFHATTADYLAFGDARFEAKPNGAVPRLAVAAPSAFGFIQHDSPGEIEVRDAKLEVRSSEGETQTLSLIGGKISISGQDDDRALLSAPGGRVDVVSVVGPGEVIPKPFAPNFRGYTGREPIPLEITSTSFGDISITDATIDVSGGFNGLVTVAGGRLFITDAGVSADAEQSGGKIFFFSEGTAEIVRTTLTARSANDFILGSGGLVQVSARSLLLEDSILDSRAKSRGAIGLLVDDELRASDSSLNLPSGISLDCGSLPCFPTDFRGSSNVLIEAGSLSMQGGQIRADASRDADPAEIAIRTQGAIDLNGVTVSANSGASFAEREPSLLFEGSQVTIRGGSSIRADKIPGSSSGSDTVGGDITIRATSGSVLFEDSSIRTTAGSSQGGGLGEGSDVVISASEHIEITNGSTLEANTVLDQSNFSIPEVGGQFTLSAPAISIRNSSIVANGELLRADDTAGGIEINSDHLEIFQSRLATEADGGLGGDIFVNAAGIEELPDGTLRATLREGQARGTLVRLVDSEVSASVGEGGDGGNVVLNSEAIVVDESLIKAKASEGEGGNILLAADTVLASRGDVNRFLDASSEAGVSGTVQVDTLTSDITPGITPLDPSFQDASSLIRPSCAARASAGREGSFHVARAAASPSTAEGLLLAFDGQGLAQVALAESPEGMPAAPVSSPPPVVASHAETIEVAMAEVASTTRGIRPKPSQSADSAPEDDDAPLRALEEYRQRAEVARKEGRAADAALALSNQARAAIELSRFDLALALLKDAKRTVDGLDPSPIQVYLGIHVGKSYEELAQASPAHRKEGMLAAHAALIEAQQRARRLDSPRALSFALGNLGSLYQLEHRTGEALIATRRALQAAEKAQAPEALYRWHWQEAQLLWEQGQASEAIASYRRAVDLLDATRQEALAQGGASQVYFQQLVAPVYLDLVNALVESAGRVEGKGVEAQLLAEARSTMERFKAAELRDYFHDECAADLEAATASLDTILDRAEGTAVVYPIVLPNRLELLVSLPGGGLMRHSVPVGSEQLETAARRFRIALQNPLGRDYRALGQQLYGWLVAPYAKDLEARNVKTLVFVPDGALRAVPMAALYDGEHFLLERYAVAVTPGLSLVDPRPLDRESAKLLLAGVSAGSGELPPLPKVKDELAAVQALYGGEVLLDRDFSQRRFATELADTKPSVVHLATHAQFTGDPATSYLLAGDGKLTLDYLAELVGPTQYRQPLELLVLSACETAAGNERAALGLAGVAIRAGARSALGSLWSISDEATYVLITDFYENLRDAQVSKAEALRQAQLALLADTEHGYAHPYYWSPYLMISNWL